MVTERLLRRQQEEGKEMEKEKGASSTVPAVSTVQYASRRDGVGAATLV